MSTSNDRIAQVEFNLDQFKTETNRAYGEIAKRLRIAEITSETLVRQVGSLKAEIEYRFDRIDMRLDAQDAHLMHLHERADKTDKRLEFLQQHADKTDKSFGEVRQDLTEIKTTLAQILARLPEKP